MSTLWFCVFEKRVKISCSEPHLCKLLHLVYGQLQWLPGTVEPQPDLNYEIGYSSSDDALIFVHRDGQAPAYAEDDGYFIYLFEKDMTIALEHMRHDLFFLHAAALEYRGKIHLLVAESGGGKSTTSWALLHHGFRYASDELAPVQLETMEVLSYPHALCLKNNPPAPYLLPEETLVTERTMHVPVDGLPAAVVAESLPLKSIIFTKFYPHEHLPSIEKITTAQAGARVYANGLNQLAHPSHGLDAAIEIAQQSHCYDLHTTDLGMTCKLLIEVLDGN